MHPGVKSYALIVRDLRFKPVGFSLLMSKNLFQLPGEFVTLSIFSMARSLNYSSFL